MVRLLVADSLCPVKGPRSVLAGFGADADLTESRCVAASHGMHRTEGKGARHQNEAKNKYAGCQASGEMPP